MQCLEKGRVGDALRTVLDTYRRRFERVACVSIVAELIRDLDRLYDLANEAGALEIFRETCRNHSLHSMVMQDPLTERAFCKPRGRTPDAVLLDYIYRPVAPRLSELGEVFHFMTATAGMAKSLIWRQEHFAKQVARTVKPANNARILAIECGHCWELELVRVLTAQRAFEIVVTDRDRDALKESVNYHSDFNIRPLAATVADLPNALAGEEFDLIYSAALLEQIESNNEVREVIVELKGLLAPEGRIILGSPAPECLGRGYMEGMMAWTRRYRSEAELNCLSADDASRRLYRDRTGSALYLQLTPDQV
ncbi:SAM-dependent methyltransferase [Bradyrhizobium sp. USDA 4341]